MHTSVRRSFSEINQYLAFEMIYRLKKARGFLIDTVLSKSMTHSQSDFRARLDQRPKTATTLKCAICVCKMALNEKMSFAGQKLLVGMLWCGRSKFSSF